MEVMVTDMKKRSILGVVIGGGFIVSAIILTLLKYKSFCHLKEDIKAIPYELEKPFDWQYLFKKY